ncbi:MAG: hypothetical protein ACPHK8_04585 [Thermoplasmatota archaeon]
MKQVVGTTSSEHYQFAWSVWQAFGMPLATVWYLQTETGPLFVSLDRLLLHELSERELRLFAEVSQWPMSPS